MVQDRRAYGIDGLNRPALYSVGQWFKNWMVRNTSSIQCSQPRSSGKVDMTREASGESRVDPPSVLVLPVYSVLDHCRVI